MKITDKNKKIISFFIIFIGISILLFTSYKVGKFHGEIDMTINMFQFEEVCNLSSNTYYFDNVTYKNNTCILDKGNISYKFGDFLIINTDEEITYNDRIKIGIFLGFTNIEQVK